MIPTVNMSPRMSRLAATAAALAGLASLAACGEAPTESDLTQTTSAVTTTYVGTATDLMNALKNNPSGNITLTSNLNASGVVWRTGTFSGTLDGAGKTISNLTVSDTAGAGASLVGYAYFATIKNLALTNLRVSSTINAGGIAADCHRCTIDRVAVEGTVKAANYDGGIAGSLFGGTVTNSYFKGTVSDGVYGAGGLVGLAGIADNVSSTIAQSYAQATSTTATLVAGTTSTSSGSAGGILGTGYGFWLTDVYAVGAVSGRSSVGGLVGAPYCGGADAWFVNRGIYRGNVTDANYPASQKNNWAGTFGAQTELDCLGRVSLLFFNTDLDKDSNYLGKGNLPFFIDQRPSSGAELTRPTTLAVESSDNIFCPITQSLVTCGDSPFTSPPWDVGTNSQNNILMNMPGPNVQLR